MFLIEKTYGFTCLLSKGRKGYYLMENNWFSHLSVYNSHMYTHGINIVVEVNLHFLKPRMTTLLLYLIFLDQTYSLLFRPKILFLMR